MDVTEIMEALDTDRPVYQREAVQAAMDHRDEVVPPLLEVLERVLQDPERYSEPGYKSFLPFYALYLLGHHRAREAHPLLVGLMGLPGETTYELFGDALPEGFPVALWKTSGGDPAGIMQLVGDRRADEYCRAAAIEALTYGVADGSLARETVVSFLQGLLTEEAASGDDAYRDAPMVYNSAAAQLSRLWPGESMELLRKALDEGLIEPGYVGMERFERDLKEGKEARLAAFEQRGQQDLARTPHQELQSWAYLNPGGTGRHRSEKSHPGLPSTREKRAAAERKKRQRKQARAARKKGRSKKKKKR